MLVVSTGVISVNSGLAKKNKHDGKKASRNKVNNHFNFLVGCHARFLNS